MQIANQFSYFDFVVYVRPAVPEFGWQVAAWQAQGWLVLAAGLVKQTRANVKIVPRILHSPHQRIQRRCAFNSISLFLRMKCITMHTRSKKDFIVTAFKSRRKTASENTKPLLRKQPCILGKLRTCKRGCLLFHLLHKGQVKYIGAALCVSYQVQV